MRFTDYVMQTQKKLMGELRAKYKQISHTWYQKKGYLLVKGDAPIMLIAHLDTVHQEPVKIICKSDDGNIIMSPQGIGGDDRCGVYAICKVYDTAKRKPWLLFTCDEEVGGLGAESFALSYENGNFLPKELGNLKCLVEIDRKGRHDAVFYDCDNKDFEEYILTKGFITQYGSYSDICSIAPTLGVAAVNLSSGYYNAHTQHEYVNLKELEMTIERVRGIVNDSCKKTFPKYEWVEKPHTYLGGYGRYYGNYGGYGGYYGYDWGKSDKAQDAADPYGVNYEKWIASLREKESSKYPNYLPDDLPDKYCAMYDELLTVYTMDELEELRKDCGDKIIQEIYAEEFCPNPKREEEKKQA